MAYWDALTSPDHPDHARAIQAEAAEVAAEQRSKKMARLRAYFFRTLGCWPSALRTPIPTDKLGWGRSLGVFFGTRKGFPLALRRKMQWAEKAATAKDLESWLRKGEIPPGRDGLPPRSLRAEPLTVFFRDECPGDLADAQDLALGLGYSAVVSNTELPFAGESLRVWALILMGAPGE